MATTFRVKMLVKATGATRFYSYQVDDVAAAVRKAAVEVAGDYGFMNARAEVTSVQAWDFEAKSWIDVAV